MILNKDTTRQGDDLNLSYRAFDEAYRVWRDGLVADDPHGMPLASWNGDDLWSVLRTTLKAESEQASLEKTHPHVAKKAAKKKAKKK